MNNLLNQFSASKVNILTDQELNEIKGGEGEIIVIDDIALG